MKKLGLLPKLIIGIILGILIGSTRIEFLTRLLVTFSGIFGNFLGYVIPLLIIGFVAPGIAELGGKAGRLLGITAGIAYISTVIAGILAFLTGAFVLPNIIAAGGEAAAEGLVANPYFEIQMPAIMGVMTALVTAFLLGLGMAAIKGDTMLHFMQEFQEIIQKVIENIIIPLLPIHIAGIFARMAYSGEVAETLAVFGRVFILVIAVHIVYIIIQYLIAGSITKVNPFRGIKNMLPAYFTAIGTQSSAATIPVTVRSTKNNDVSDEVAEFAIPLCATIHLAGSTITLTICAIAVMALEGMTLTFGQVFPFILMLGVTMVAAPGVPGGAIMAALGLLETMLGFTDGQLALMMALYIAQDSFGTAANVTGDGAIALIVNKFARS
ncbi:dicarboxylate/amino acid:cation symporter [Clostridium formicaceticum]|uniref:Proton/sodium-glutamate symport protein n=1 Tax=Clostridium formicaceticum TaxID=1497 RepID=A0AAC9RK19_9CLOT|nr:dicarboxylate/amino acid:cation symporter [Clostridium formicaceticum]AOY76619.1 sodium:proton antiporter [Clostridium formicaceticum]ARE87039.1 Proton/sodium-glutamate symport protein [Clostridium formicaceticum]